MLLTEILPRAVSDYGENLAVVCGQTRLSYRELGKRVAKLSDSLRKAGVGRGDRVALLHKNCHRMLESYFAAVHAGAVLVPLNFRLTARDLAYIINDTESGVMIVDKEFASVASETAGRLKRKCKMVWSGSDGEGQFADAFDYESLIEKSAAESLLNPAVAEDEPANLY